MLTLSSEVETVEALFRRPRRPHGCDAALRCVGGLASLGGRRRRAAFRLRGQRAAQRFGLGENGCVSPCHLRVHHVLLAEILDELALLPQAVAFRAFTRSRSARAVSQAVVPLPPVGAAIGQEIAAIAMLA